MRLSKFEWAVIALTLLGALIRFWNIGFQMMNYDEEFTINFARPALSVFELAATSLTYDYTPPLYYIAAHFSMLLFGMTATAIRIPSVICGVLFVPVMYFVGREYKDELFGLLAAGFSAIYYNSVFYSKFGRSYSMAILFFSLAFYFFMRVLKGDKHSGVWFAAFALCSMYTHLYSVIPLGLMVLYLLWERKALQGVALIVIGSLPLALYIVPILISREVGRCSYFGSTLFEIAFLIPLDLFTYSSFIIMPVILWSFWKHRTERLMQIVFLICLGTWISMFALFFVTPIILHYAMFLVPMLILLFVLPFYEAIRKDEILFHHLVIILVLVVLEAVQIAAIATVQRAWFY
jgi:mannosyltransferase